MTNRYIRNGSGLEKLEGFSVPDGSGYTSFRSNFGCLDPFPGFFMHRYIGASPGTDLGSAWTFSKASGTGFGSTLYDITNRNTRDSAFVSCSGFPAVNHCLIQATWASSTYGVGVDGGGPAGYMTFDLAGAVNCYNIRVLNTNGDITVQKRVRLERTLSNTPTTLADSTMPDNPANGPLNIHTYFLELQLVNSVHADDVNIKVFVDNPAGSPIINFTDTSGSRISTTNDIDPNAPHPDLWPNRKPGMVGGADTVWSRYLATDLD